MNESLNHEAVCRTAPATTGLLTTQGMPSKLVTKSALRWIQSSSHNVPLSVCVPLSINR